MSATVRHLAAVPTDQAAQAGWDAPVPVGTNTAAPPPFPLHVLPGWARDMVEAVAVFTQTDTSMAAGVLLSVLSTCGARRLVVEGKPGWREPVNSYVAAVAGPGERKTPVHGAMTRPLFQAQKQMADQVKPLVEQEAARRDIAQRAAEQARATAAKADADKRDAATAEALAAVLAVEEITVPTMPRLIIDDHTPEALVSRMAENGGRIAVISDEGGIFDTLAGRYSGTPNLDPYLKGYSGGHLSTDRQTRAGETIEDPALTVGVMTQPAALRKFGSNAELFGRGLPARFWFIMPRSLAGYRDQDSPPVPASVADRYESTVRTMAVTLAGWDEQRVLTLTAEASRVRAAAAATIEEQLRPGGALHDVREWANKLFGAMLRLAGLLHLAHHPTDAWQRQISDDTMSQAAQVTAWLIAHYQAAVALVHGDPAGETAHDVLAVLVAKDMRTFTRRELHRRVQRKLPRAEQVMSVLATLAQHGWVRTTAEGDYELHPVAHTYINGAAPTGR
ncbi:YfjI family protein [Catellatospora sp. NPDC049609]|uniref:YfjI family protein n=1 Tax=Catellatospora sp. NPDC049609 TaxID=3155505 RepID=UPI003413EF8E